MKLRLTILAIAFSVTAFAMDSLFEVLVMNGIALLIFSVSTLLQRFNTVITVFNSILDKQNKIYEALRDNKSSSNSILGNITRLFPGAIITSSANFPLMKDLIKKKPPLTILSDSELEDKLNYALSKEDYDTATRIREEKSRRKSDNEGDSEKKD